MILKHFHLSQKTNYLLSYKKKWEGDKFNKSTFFASTYNIEHSKPVQQLSGIAVLIRGENGLKVFEGVKI